MKDLRDCLKVIDFDALTPGAFGGGTLAQHVAVLYIMIPFQVPKLVRPTLIERP